MPLQFDEATHTYHLDGRTLPSVTHICRFLAYDYKSDRPWLAEAAARRGSAVHEACLLLDYGELPEDSPALAGYLTAYRRFLEDYRPDWALIEHPMGSLALGYAGTLDRYGTMDGAKTLLDIKSGQLHKAALQAQLTGYERLLSPAFTVERRYGLKLSPDGTYLLQEAAPAPGLFDACLALHEATKRRRGT